MPSVQRNRGPLLITLTLAMCRFQKENKRNVIDSTDNESRTCFITLAKKQHVFRATELIDFT